MTEREAIAAAVPRAAGIGLRTPHVQEILATRPPIAWLEVHAENYVGGGPALRSLNLIRRDYPVSLHGVGLALGRQLLIENPSSYLRFRHSPIPEPEFLAELVRRTGCGLLCDVNNIYVSAHNLAFDAAAYVDV